MKVIKPTVVLTLSVPVASVCALAVFAQGLAFNPGMWETTMTQTSPFTGTNTETKAECVTDTQFDPSSMLQSADGCELIQQSVSGNTLTFSMTCNQPAGEAQVNGRFETDGQTGNGDMQVNMSISGQAMQMDISWQAKRLGDC